MMRLSTTLATAAILATVALLVGCGDDNNDNATEPEDLAIVRIVNASPSTAGLNASSPDDGTLATGLNFQNTNAASGCSTVEKNDNGRINFTAGSANTAVGGLDQYFVGRQSYTVVFFAPDNAVAFPESFGTPASGNMGLRFVNGTGAAGDLYLTTPTGAISGAPTIANFGNRQVSGFSDPVTTGGVFSEYPLTNTRVRLFNVGTTTNPRADFTISNLAANHVGTVVLTPPPTGGTTTGFLVNTCQ